MKENDASIVSVALQFESGTRARSVSIPMKIVRREVRQNPRRWERRNLCSSSGIEHVKTKFPNSWRDLVYPQERSSIG